MEADNSNFVAKSDVEEKAKEFLEWLRKRNQAIRDDPSIDKSTLPNFEPSWQNPSWRNERSVIRVIAGPFQSCKLHSVIRGTAGPFTAVSTPSSLEYELAVTGPFTVAGGACPQSG